MAKVEWPETNGKPCNRRRFLFDNRKTTLENFFNLGRFCRLRFEPNEQRNIDHVMSPPLRRADARGPSLYSLRAVAVKGEAGQSPERVQAGVPDPPRVLN